MRGRAILVFFWFCLVDPNCGLKVVLDISENPNDVQFFLYTDKKTRHELILDDISSLDLVKPEIKTFFVMDGFLSNSSMPMTQTTKNMLFRQSPDSNIITVDWRRLNGNGLEITGYTEMFYLYKKAVARVDIVGRRVADMLYFLKTQKNILYTQFHLVGHSLGAHISGAAGFWSKKVYKQTIETITGLDPAGPSYSRQSDMEKRLFKGDAVFIEMYHTNRGILGDTAIGTANVNVFVNNGNFQPGCEESVPELKANSIICSHSYSWRLYNKCSESECKACPCVPIKECICTPSCPTCSDGVQLGLRIDRRVSGSFNLQSGPMEEPEDEKMPAVQFNKF